MSMRRRSRMALTIALFCVASSVAVGQPSPPQRPPQGGDVNVTNSPNSISGGNVSIGTINANTVIYQEARRDPRTREFVGTLRRFTGQFVAMLHGFNQMMGNGLREGQDTPYYMFALDDPAMRQGPDQTGVIYFVMVGDINDETAAFPVHDCEGQRDVSVMGWVMTATLETSGGRARARALSGRDEAFLDRICEGLGRPVSSLLATADRDRSRGGDSTVMDYLSRYSGFFGLMLMPSHMRGQEIEEGLTRYYWAGAMAMRYNRVPRGAELMARPEVFDQMQSFQRGEWMDFQIPVATGLTNPTSYPPQARQEFGALIDRLDSDWVEYLARSAVTIQNRQHQVIENGRPARFVPRFTLAQVGSTAFWRAANDLRETYGQTHCIAQQFLVDREYVAPEDMPYNSQCALNEIRLPAR